MQLVKINVIRIEAAQGSVDGVEQVFSRAACIPSGWPHFSAALCPEDKPCPLIAEPAACDDFGTTGLRTRGIYVSGIDEVNPRLRRLIEHSMRLRFIRLLSECSRSEDHARDR